MPTITFRFNTAETTRALTQLKERLPQAARRAISRAATSARAGLASDVARDMGLKVGVVKDELTITDATTQHLVARIHASAKRIPLEKFGAKGPFPSRGRGTVRVRGKTYPNAFLAVMRSGHRGVFQRVLVTGGERRSRGAWSKNLPIGELKGASVWHVATKHLPAALQRGEESLRKNLQSELRFAASVVAAA